MKILITMMILFSVFPGLLSCSFGKNINTDAEIGKSEIILLKDKKKDLNGQIEISGTVALSGTGDMTDILYENKLTIGNNISHNIIMGEFTILIDPKDIIDEDVLVIHSSEYGKVGYRFKELKPNHSYKIKATMCEKKIAVLKPVIYLYPTQPMEVTLKMDVNGMIDFSYPKYQDGWKVMAFPNGKLKHNDKSLDYLFYDTKNTKYKFDESAPAQVMASKDVVPFLEQQLTAFGLTDKEANDFIVFWAPRLKAHKYVSMQFKINKDYDEISVLKVTPKPDQILRVFMTYSGYENLPVNQILQSSVNTYNFKREGFVLVEWGGAEVSNELPSF